ncbi:MAG TPA: LPS export ABC transporter periplasmic protein LptC [Limnochordia bacterium]
MLSGGRRRAPGQAGLLAVLLTACLLGVLIGAALRQPPRDEHTPTGATASVRLTAAEVIGRYGGQTQWSLQVRTVEDSGDVVRLEGVQDGAFYRAGRPEWGVTAGGGAWRRTANRLDLSGGVVLTQRAGEGPHAVIRTERLVWDAPAARLSAATTVRMERGTQRLVAGGMIADVTGRWVRLFGGVRMEQDARGDGEELSAEAVVYYLDTGRIELIGPVELHLRLAW